jgi:hypothetical protein
MCGIPADILTEKGANNSLMPEIPPAGYRLYYY